MRYAFLLVLLALAASPGFSQSEIAVFSRMVDTQEAATDTEASPDKRSVSMETLVRALRDFKGFEHSKSYTIFVPNNEAFKRVPKGTIQYFLDPEHKQALEELVSFHVLEGKISHDDLLERIKTGNGKAVLKTVSGFKLTASADAKGNITLLNEAGKAIHITAYNWSKGSGLVHVVDSVIIPYDRGLEEQEDENMKD